MQIFLNNFEEILDAFSPFYGNIIILFHVLNILYIIFTYLNINVLNPYVYKFNRMIQFFVCLFLLVKFHPFRKHVLREGESRIIFSSALFLLLNLGIIDYMNNTVNIVEERIKKINLIYNNE